MISTFDCDRIWRAVESNNDSWTLEYICTVSEVPMPSVNKYVGWLLLESFIAPAGAGRYRATQRARQMRLTPYPHCAAPDCRITVTVELSGGQIRDVASVPEGGWEQVKKHFAPAPKKGATRDEMWKWIYERGEPFTSQQLTNALPVCRNSVQTYIEILLSHGVLERGMKVRSHMRYHIQPGYGPERPKLQRKRKGDD